MEVDCSLFEYRYRDSGNFKTYGALLLCGQTDTARELIRECLEVDDLFVAEQVGVTSLCEAHWSDCGGGPSDLDHAYHEFIDIRPATDEERVMLPIVGALDVLLDRFKAAAGRWDVSLSPNCDL